MRINGLVASLCELGEEMEDSHVVMKILHVILKKLRQVGVAIEMLTDLDTMTMEQLVGRLLIAEVAAEDVGDCCSRRSSGRVVVVRAPVRRKCVAAKAAIAVVDTARTTLVHAQAATEVLQAASNNCNKRGHIAKFYPERSRRGVCTAVKCAMSRLGRDC
jgi:hypothetical protein